MGDYHLGYLCATPKCGKIDVLATKKYALLPPSIHPDGPHYEWVIKPNGELPVVDLREWNLDGLTEETEDIEDIEDSEAIYSKGISIPPEVGTPSVLDQYKADTQKLVLQAIISTQPKEEGQRNTAIFDFCRYLKAIPELAPLEAKELKPIVTLWHEKALPVIGTKPFSETWAEFLYGWPRVKYPKGEDTLKKAVQKALDAQDSRQRQVVLAVNLYAADHEGWYPQSVATAAMLGRTWRWQEPRMMKACQPRAEGYRCSMAGYLRAYLPKAVLLSCPSSPATYPYLEDFWRAGEQWDNPDTTFTDDSALGSFCFYWNYVGYLSEQERPFRGPQTDDGRDGGSRLLISDYFGFNHWRSPEAFGSCERFSRAEVTADTHEAPPFWLQKPRGRPDRTHVQIKLRAGFVDGHVEAYRPSETATLEVAKALDGTTPAFTGLGLGAGEFYIPRDGATLRP